MAGGCVKCIRYLVFVFNFIFWLLGLGILGFGIYLRVDPTIAQVVGATPSQEFYVIAYVLIGIGAVMTVVGFLGCCGAYQESTCLLGTFFACLLIIFGAQVAAGVVGYLNKDVVAEYWNTTLTTFTKSYGWTNSSAQTTAMNGIQRAFSCCGASGPGDYVSSEYCQNKVACAYYPPSCCDKPSATLASTIQNSVVGLVATTAAPTLGCKVSESYTVGCINKSMAWFAAQWWILVAVGGSILLVELLGMIFGITLCCSVRRRNDAYDGYEQPESQNLVS